MNYNGFRIESKDDLEMVAAMQTPSSRDSSSPQTIQKKKILDRNRWTNELNKLRKNTRRILKVENFEKFARNR